MEGSGDMEPKYKVGDKVKFLRRGVKYTGVIMNLYKNNNGDYVYEIYYRDLCANLQKSKWIYESRICGYNEEAKMEPKYNIGDKVTFKRCGYMYTGVIMDIDRSCQDSEYIYNIDYHNYLTGHQESRPIFESRICRRNPSCYNPYHIRKPKANYPAIPPIKKVIFNNPATIVFWEDGTKTVVKTKEIKTIGMANELFHKLDASQLEKFIGLKSGQMYKSFYKYETDSFCIVICDEFDPEKGLAMAIAKKALGNEGNYYKEFQKWLSKEE